MKPNLRFIKPLIFVFVLLIISSAAFAVDYEITKVVEIGPADESFMSWPLRWSPDGKWLAYFHDGFLMLSDTLGTSHPVKKIDFAPRRFEWISNEEIIGYFDEGRNLDSSRQILMQIDVTTGAETIIEEYMRYKRGHSPEWFEGPWRTGKGNIYYFHTKQSGPTSVLRHNCLDI